MIAKPRTSTFIDNIVIEIQEALTIPINVSLRNEEGEICCKTERKISLKNEQIKWEKLNDLPYGVYTLECCQGEVIIETKMVKRI